VESLKALCEKYFNEVKIVDKGMSNIYAICKLPKSLCSTNYYRALNVEFNMEYPNEYRHNRHKGLVSEIIRCLIQIGRLKES
jgi:hypothetical protein